MIALPFILALHLGTPALRPPLAPPRVQLASYRPPLARLTLLDAPVSTVDPRAGGLSGGEVLVGSGVALLSSVGSLGVGLIIALSDTHSDTALEIGALVWVALQLFVVP